LGGALGEVRSADGEFADFADFADAALLQLRRTAFLLCGNWHTAEDLAQTTLAKMFVSWRKIKRSGAERCTPMPTASW
jgi:DNA-directed RNA polymerase specialized sigma24 family protein